MNHTRLTPILVMLTTLGMALISLMATSPEPAAGAPAGPRVRDFLGVNVGDRSSSISDISQVVGWVRDYHRWYNFEQTNNSYSFNTLDSWYGGLHDAGVNVLATVEFAPGWSSSDGTITGNPYYTGDGTQPANYAEHSEYMAQFAARFGKTAYPPGDSRIETTDKVTGLGYVGAMESYNEPDYWWWTPTFPAAKYAQMLEADYNGYGTTTSASLPLLGVKKADPNMAMVHGGLLGTDTTYLDGVLANLAPGQLPFDALNYHIMMMRTPNVGGTSPEAGPFVSSIQTWKTWRDAHTPGKPIWITETGWDTYNDGATFSKIWAPEASAANYLLRAMALGMGNGLDRMFIYMYKDALVNSTTQYMSMGLVGNTGSGEGAKKAGWYYLATTKALLGEYLFDHIERNGTGSPAVYSYIFSKPETGEKVTMIWCIDPNSPVDNGTSVSNFKLTIPGAQTATLIVPAMGFPAGQQSTLTVSSPGGSGANVTLPSIGERPQFIYYKPVPGGTSTPTSTATPRPITGNLIANPSFELSSNGSQPDGWQIPSWVLSSVTRSSGAARDGSYSMLLQSSSGPGFTLNQDIHLLKSGGSYVFSGWVNIPAKTGSFNVALQLQPLNSNNGPLSTINLGQSFTTTTSGWVQIQVPIAMPSNAVGARVLIKITSLRATVYLDQFSLLDANAPTATSTSAPTATPTATPVASATSTTTATATPANTATATPTPVGQIPGVNLLVNPGMEIDANGNGQPDGWDFHWPAAGVVSLSGQDPHSGSLSLRNSPPSGSPSYVGQQDVAAFGGKSYNFRGWVNIPKMASYSRVSFQVQPLTGAGGTINGYGPATIGSYTTSTAGWQEVTGSIAMPAGTGKARIIIKIESLAGTVYVDDLEFSLSS